MNSEILEALSQIAREKNVSRDLVIETLEAGLLSAAKRKFGTADNLQVSIDQNTGDIKLLAEKQVVEEVEDPFLQISLDRAREIDLDVDVGGEVTEELSFADFGRNAIQTAKQILVQRVREAERERIYEDYQERIGEIVTGTVQQINRGDIIVNLGRIEAVVPSKEQIRRERYRQGDTIRAYIVDVLRTTKGPQVILSRTHPGFLDRLFQIEVPEIYEGIVQVRAVARAPGERAKVAVSSNDPRIDPVGACVGIKGSRVQAVVRELSGERIDIVPWSEDQLLFLTRALSPAEAIRAEYDEDEEDRLIAIVEEDQRSLAIGKSGQNARLVAQLMGRNIDIVTESEYRDRLIRSKRRRMALTDLPGVGTKMAETLRAHGIDSVEQISTLEMADLCAVPGVGRATAEKILNAMEEMESQDPELEAEDEEE